MTIDLLLVLVVLLLLHWSYILIDRDCLKVISAHHQGLLRFNTIIGAKGLILCLYVLVLLLLRVSLLHIINIVTCLTFYHLVQQLLPVISDLAAICTMLAHFILHLLAKRLKLLLVPL